MAEEIRVVRAKANPTPMIIFIVLFALSFLAFVYAFVLFTTRDKAIDAGFVPAEKGRLFTIQELRAGKWYEQNPPVQGYRQALALVTAQQRALIKAQDDLQKAITGNTEQSQTLLPIVTDRIQDLKTKVGQQFASLGGTPPEIASLWDVIDAQQKVIDQLKAAKDDLSTKLSEAEAGKTAAENRLAEAKKTYDDLTAKAQASATAAEAASEKARQSYDAEIASLKTKFDEEHKATEKRLKDLLDENTKQQEQLNQIKKEQEESRQVKTVPETSPLEKPVGTVSVADLQNGFVFINLGLNNHIVAGMKFVIRSRIEPGGTPIEKGQIEVRKVYEDVSSCAILPNTTKIDRPIVEGDPLYSAVYSPQKPLVFVLMGPFGRFNDKTLQAQLERYGNKVEPAVNLTTSFLVVGDAMTKNALESSENYKRAHELGVPIMREDSLANYIGLE